MVHLAPVETLMVSTAVCCLFGYIVSVGNLLLLVRVGSLALSARAGSIYIMLFIASVSLDVLVWANRVKNRLLAAARSSLTCILKLSWMSCLIWVLAIWMLACLVLATVIR